MTRGGGNKFHGGVFENSATTSSTRATSLAARRKLRQTTSGGISAARLKESSFLRRMEWKRQRSTDAISRRSDPRELNGTSRSACVGRRRPLWARMRWPRSDPASGCVHAANGRVFRRHQGPLRNSSRPPAHCRRGAIANVFRLPSKGGPLRGHPTATTPSFRAQPVNSGKSSAADYKFNDNHSIYGRSCTTFNLIARSHLHDSKLKTIRPTACGRVELQVSQMDHQPTLIQRAKINASERQRIRPSPKCEAGHLRFS